MKLKVSDLLDVLEYATKEQAITINITAPEMDVATYFEFTDLEKRECKIKIYAASANVTPDLTKTMKLYTRLKRTGKVKK